MTRTRESHAFSCLFCVTFCATLLGLKGKLDLFVIIQFIVNSTEVQTIKLDTSFVTCPVHAFIFRNCKLGKYFEKYLAEQ